MAENRAGDYLVRVGLVESLAKPDLRLVSDPPLGETDVLAVLLFGRPTSELGSSEAAGLQRLTVGLVAD
jgi:autotransporter translocation and assembly factor TamB